MQRYPGRSGQHRLLSHRAPLALALRAIGLAGLLGTSACAEALDFGEACTLPVEALPVRVVVEDPLAELSCSERASVGADLAATMVVEGSDPVELIVDAETLEATGNTWALDTEAIHPLVITYALTVAGGSSHVLAVRWDAIDLTGDRCDSSATLEDESHLLLSPSELDLFLAGDDGGDTDAAVDAVAVSFARDHLADPEPLLDHDGDGRSNAEEACAGSL